MGNEAKCAARISGKRHQGKALLETSELVFRGAECRLKIAFQEIRGVTAGKGELRVKTKDRLTVFELGPLAEKWREKILHPKTRAEKLGIKAGLGVFVAGELDEEFLRELEKAGAALKKSAEGADLIFFGTNERSGLEHVSRIAGGMKGPAALWVVYPKGRREPTENDVLRAGREAGLKDVKVVGFSASHTALKFVIPVERR
jgi:nucleotide-binding universal stress UspA family protein